MDVAIADSGPGVKRAVLQATFPFAGLPAKLLSESIEFGYSGLQLKVSCHVGPSFGKNEGTIGSA